MTLNLSSRVASVITVCLATIGLLLWATAGNVAEGATWYKGNLHTHTAWSDGNELPELAAHWYKNNGYNFLVLSDHYQLMEGTKNSPTVAQAPWLTNSIANAANLFGADWNVTSGTGTSQKVQLKTFDQVGAKLDESGKYLLIQGEEVTSSAVHVNAINLSQPITASTATTNTAQLNENLALIAAQTNRTILAQINHPNCVYRVSPEDAAHSTARFIEVCNAFPKDTNQYGDAAHPGTEKLWDIANTIRLGTLKTAPLYGTAGEDTHSYHTIATTESNPGRAWVMVHADSLSTDAILTAMSNGDFYASTGVTLKQLDYDSTAHTLTVGVEANAGVHYRIDFIGTKKGVDPTKQPDGTYSSEIGKVLESVTSTSASYTLTGDELYVRAFIYSDKAMQNPSSGGVGKEQAWTQPVGWTVVPEPGTAAICTMGAFVTSIYVWLRSIM